MTINGSSLGLFAGHQDVGVPAGPVTARMRIRHTHCRSEKATSVGLATSSSSSTAR